MYLGTWNVLDFLRVLTCADDYVFAAEHNRDNSFLGVPHLGVNPCPVELIETDDEIRSSNVVLDSFDGTIVIGF